LERIFTDIQINTDFRLKIQIEKEKEERAEEVEFGKIVTKSQHRGFFCPFSRFLEENYIFLPTVRDKEQRLKDLKI